MWFDNMRRFLLSATLCLTTLTFALVLTARAWGATQPAALPASLRGFVEGCEGISPPCWWGIIPGKTTLTEAATWLARAGYRTDSLQVLASPLLYVGESAPIPAVFFYADDRIPSNVALEIPCEQSPCDEQPIMTIEFVFRDRAGQHERVRLADFVTLLGAPSFVDVNPLLGTGQVMYPERLLTVDVDGRMTWDSPWRTTFSARMRAVNQGDSFRPWRGFLSLSQYCRREPAFASCAGLQ
jgi:hypothetical protein